VTNVHAKTVRLLRSQTQALTRHRHTAALIPVTATLLAMALCCARPVFADSVDVNIPSFLGFDVQDVTQATTGSPDPFTVAFSNAVLTSGNTLRISVIASAPSFTPPAGPAIPVSNVTWTPTGAVHGSGNPGTLSGTVYSDVYDSAANATSGSVNLSFSLAAPGGGIRAGNHTVSATWKIESVSP
jgi:hypothetical protein